MASLACVDVLDLDDTAYPLAYRRYARSHGREATEAMPKERARRYSIEIGIGEAVQIVEGLAGARAL